MYEFVYAGAYCEEAAIESFPIQQNLPLAACLKFPLSLWHWAAGLNRSKLSYMYSEAKQQEVHGYFAACQLNYLMIK